MKPSPTASRDLNRLVRDCCFLMPHRPLKPPSTSTVFVQQSGEVVVERLQQIALCDAQTYEEGIYNISFIPGEKDHRRRREETRQDYLQKKVIVFGDYNPSVQPGLNFCSSFLIKLRTYPDQPNKKNIQMFGAEKSAHISTSITSPHTSCKD